MSKTKILCIITLACYLALILVGVLLGALTGGVIADGLDNTEGFGAAAVGILLGVLLIMGYTYAAIGILPVIFKLVQLFSGKKVFAVLSLPFDLVYILFNGSLIASFISEPLDSVLSIIMCGVLFIISVIAIVANIMSLTTSE